MKYVLEHTLKPLQFVPHEVNSQEYGSTTIQIEEQNPN